MLLYLLAIVDVYCISFLVSIHVLDSAFMLLLLFGLQFRSKSLTFGSAPVSSYLIPHFLLARFPSKPLHINNELFDSRSHHPFHDVSCLVLIRSLSHWSHLVFLFMFHVFCLLVSSLVQMLILSMK